MLASDPVVAVDLVFAAVAFSIQLAIESGRDPAQMRVLERELFSFLKASA
jgi:hypothetical protein